MHTQHGSISQRELTGTDSAVRELRAAEPGAELGGGGATQRTLAGRGLTLPQGCATRRGPQGALGQPDSGRGPQAQVLCAWLVCISSESPGSWTAWPAFSPPWALDAVAELCPHWEAGLDWGHRASGASGVGSTPPRLGCPPPLRASTPISTTTIPAAPGRRGKPGAGSIGVLGKRLFEAGLSGWGGSASSLHPASWGSRLPRLPSCLAHLWPPPPFSVRDFAVEAPRRQLVSHVGDVSIFTADPSAAPGGAAAAHVRGWGGPRAALPPWP